MKRQSIIASFIVILALASMATTSLANMESYTSIPPFVLRGADSNVLLDLSIETPMQGAAYNDQPYDANNDGDTTDAGDCNGRVNRDGGTVGICYFKTKEYLGIFDPEKCYVYNNNRFEPSGATNVDHECNGKWSGNFLNWATMTAIDEFRWALTGGNRVVDTNAVTVLERGNMGLSYGHNWYPIKYLNAADNVAPNTVTPSTEASIYIYNHGYQFDIGTQRDGAGAALSLDEYQDLNVRVKVCDPTEGLEDNCVDYGGYYKSEGLIQKNSDRMRFALMSYSRDNTHGRDGGVLRSNMKYVGPKMPSGVDNPDKEWDIDGFIIDDPEANPAGNSGILNYLNKFGASGYKSYDPASELYYECINYYKARGRTPEYADGLDAAGQDGFPVVTAWNDPIQYTCQPNYIVGINDANPWHDKRLPGTFFTSDQVENPGDLNWSDFGAPANADPDINVRTLTNTVGQLQGINGTNRCVGCTANDCDWSATNKLIPGLGEVAGTCPWPGKQNSYYIAGLAYYANANDIRPLMTGRQSVTTFMIDTQEYSASPLVGEMNMLWLTGKYGGFIEKDFVDTNADGNVYEPNSANEWDVDGDNEPDNFVLANEPKKLVDALNRAFTDILKRGASGTAASVISSTRAGAGAVYQSIFHPYYTDANCLAAQTHEVNWVGEVHSLFVDPWGNMREDTNQNRKLDLVESAPGADDRDLIILFDSSDVYKLDDANEDGELDPGEDWTDTNADGELQISEITVAASTLGNIKYIWSSNKWLNDTTLVTNAQRATYISNEKRRHIFTFADSNGDMAAAAARAEEVPFTTAAANMAKISPYLHLFTPFSFSPAVPPPGIRDVDYAQFLTNQANRVVNYIRGEDQGQLSFAGSIMPAMRARQVDYDCDSTTDTWRLGDVIHSTPTVVATPAEDYDLIYRDITYASFYTKYRDRRHVLYVGANDGMVHAFNAGFYDPSQDKFWKSYNAATGVYSDGATDPDIGAELWGYIPHNLLPHLYWLTDPNYSHIYYADLKPKVFDAKIFPVDATHPYGWGTVMVVGMRLGGATIRTDKDHDGTYEPADAVLPDQEMKSAYMIFDITDPEQPPELLAEISLADLGFTTGTPGVIIMDPSDAAVNDWYLVLGSGPTDLNSATSDQRAKIYVLDLKELAQNRNLVDQSANDPPLKRFQLGTTTFVGDLVSVDFDLDYRTDVVYYGMHKKFDPDYRGRMKRLVINDDTDPTNWFNSTLYNARRPILAAPSVARDRNGRIWVYFGTGRFLTRSDITYNDQQYYLGIKEPWDVSQNLTWGTTLVADLLDVSDVVVFQGGEVKCEDAGGNLIDCAAISDTNGNGKDDFIELESTVDGLDGWVLQFDTTGERNLGQATLLGEILTFTTYVPDSDPCQYEGNSNLYGLYYKTGTSFSRSIIGLDTRELSGKKETLKKISLGQGLTVTPNIHVGRESGSKAFIQTSTGAIEVVEQANPGVTKSGKASWREETD